MVVVVVARRSSSSSGAATRFMGLLTSSLPEIAANVGRRLPGHKLAERQGGFAIAGFHRRDPKVQCGPKNAGFGHALRLAAFS